MPDREPGNLLPELHAEVVHAIAGRKRLRIAQLKEQPELAACLEQHLVDIDGLSRFDVKPRSNSVILVYDSNADASVTAALRALFPRLRDVSQPGPAQPDATSQHDLAGEIAAFFGWTNRNVENATGGVDLKILVPLALLAFSLLGMLAAAVRQRKLPVPTWYDLLWFAFNTFVILNLTLAKRNEQDSADAEKNASATASN